MVDLTDINENILSTVGLICMALLVLIIRFRAAQKPVTVKKILIPPLGMSTGFLMFVVPETHIPLAYAGIAFAVGLVFSSLLIRTTKMEIVNEHIYVKRSKAFAFILIGLVVIRIALHEYVQHYISVMQTAAVFFVLAFGMIAPWRIAMYVQFQKLGRIMANPTKRDRDSLSNN